MLRRHQPVSIVVSALLLAAGSVRLGGTPLGQFDWSPGTWATPMVILSLAVPQFPRRWISLALIMATVGLLEAGRWPNWGARGGWRCSSGCS